MPFKSTPRQPEYTYWYDSFQSTPDLLHITLVPALDPYKRKAIEAESPQPVSRIQQTPQSIFRSEQVSKIDFVTTTEAKSSDIPLYLPGPFAMAYNPQFQNRDDSYERAPKKRRLTLTDQVCYEYCCSAFALYEDVRTLKLGNLDNPIHPIFARERFSSEFDYALIEPSLRLATLCLQSDAAARFINIMVDGQILDLKGLPIELSDLDVINEDGTVTRYGWARRFPHPGQEQVTEQTRRRARTILDAMVDMVEYHLKPAGEGDDEDGPEAAFGRQMGVEGPLLASAFRVFPQGCRSRIEIVTDNGYEDLVRRAERVAKSRNATGNTTASRQTDLMVKQFEIAKVLVHEFAHALEAASHGHRGGEFFFWKDAVIEPGYALESQIFGGDIQSFTANVVCESMPWQWKGRCKRRSGKAPRNYLVLNPWPSKHTETAYSGLDGGLDSLIRDRRYGALRRVPLKYIEELFSKDFWDTQVPGGSTSALHPSTVGNWIFDFGHAESSSEDGLQEEYQAPVPMRVEDVVEQFGAVRAARLCPLPFGSENLRPERLRDVQQDEVLQTCSLEPIGGSLGASFERGMEKAQRLFLNEPAKASLPFDR